MGSYIPSVLRRNGESYGNIIESCGISAAHCSPDPFYRRTEPKADRGKSSTYKARASAIGQKLSNV